MPETRSYGFQFARDRMVAFLAFVLVAVVALFVVENPQAVPVNLVFHQGEVPLGLWSLLMFAGGVAVAAVPALLMLRGSRPPGDERRLLLLLLAPPLFLCGVALLSILL